MVEVFFILCQSTPLDPEMLTALTNFDYRMILVLWDTSRFSVPCYYRYEIVVDQLLQNVIRPHSLASLMLMHVFAGSPRLSQKNHPSLLTALPSHHFSPKAGGIRIRIRIDTVYPRIWQKQGTLLEGEEGIIPSTLPQGVSCVINGQVYQERDCCACEALMSCTGYTENFNLDFHTGVS